MTMCDNLCVYISMLIQKKGKQVRLYILEDDEPILDKLSEATTLDTTTIMTLLVSAGLKACSANGNRIPLPLKFAVTSNAESPINEASPPYKTRK